MPEEFNLQELKKQYPDFFKKISLELINFIFSKETSSQIANVCSENGVTGEEKVEEIAYRITLALLNKLPKENLAIALESGVGLPAETAQKISSEVSRLIFSAAPKPELGPGQEKPALTKMEAPKEPEEPPKPPRGPDTYREPLA